MNKIAILGGSGFVGSYIVQELLKQNFTVKLINRNKIPLISQNCEQSVIDLFSDNLYHELQDFDCLIYNIGIIREYPRKGISFQTIHEDLAVHAIKSAEKAGIKKFILMSANKVELCRTGYEKSKFASEQCLVNSKMNWTIFRPSIIFGNPGAKIEFCSQVKRDIINIPLPLPLFFNGINVSNAGSMRMNPIHVKNVAEFFAKSINLESSNFKIYELGGLKEFSWKEMLKIISSVCKKRKYSVPVPFIFIKLLASIFDQFDWFPVTKDQLIMLSDGNSCSSKKYFSEFDINEIPFSVEELKYLR
tara:strand:- start:3704 stop:4615 length:912 start_codon:yes stop_codon:yes gene_type:complete